MTTPAWTLLAESTPPGAPPIDENLVSPGFLGFLSFVFLIVAVVLLYRSMRTQLRKVDPALPDGPADRMREEDRRVIAEAEERGAKQQTADGATQQKDSGAPGPDRPAG